jgi:large subunit ribosomal protein L9
MKVILHEDVPDLGGIGDIVSVANGYARNYLIPKNIAVKASTKNAQQLNHQKRLVETHKAKIAQNASELAAKLENVSCTIPVLVGEQDKLFGSVSARDVEEALASEGFSISRRKIILEEPIKSVGVYTATIRLHEEVKAKLKVWVVAK